MKTINDELMQKAQRARTAAEKLAQKTTEEKNAALHLTASLIQQRTNRILAANIRDLEQARRKGTAPALLDRLLLTQQRLGDMADALEKLTELHDPVGDCVDERVRPNGLHIRQIRVPLGVVGMVYEARPNVTADAAGLCLKTGNAAYLRGSGTALETNRALVEVIHEALRRSALPADSIQLLEDTRHETADRFFKLNNWIDVLIPRGSARLIKQVVTQATIPVIETGAGNCHLFIDETARPDMAVSIAINAKAQRPSVCNSIETIIVQKNWFSRHGRMLIDALQRAGVECRIDSVAAAFFPQLRVATEQDWHQEYLDKIVAIKLVDTVDQAIDHINHYGTKHSESIISEAPEHVRRFFRLVDASTLYHNASTRFTDGQMFGFGAEIGISTQKLHARGPMGLETLTSTKYLVEGNGQVRS